MTLDLSFLPPSTAAAVRSAAADWTGTSMSDEAAMEAYGRVALALEEAERAAGTREDDVAGTVRLHMVRILGIGDDRLVLHEATHVDVRTARTLADVDRDGAPAGSPIRLGTDASCVVDGGLRTMTLETARSHLLSALERRLTSVLAELVPHSTSMLRVPRSADGRPGSLRMQLDADGREPLVLHLRRRRSELVAKADAEHGATFAARAGTRIWILKERTSDHDRTVVFSGPDAVEATSLRSFVRDVASMEGPPEELERLEAEVVDPICAEWRSEIEGLLSCVDAGVAVLDGAAGRPA